MTTDDLRAAAERVVADPPLCRCDKPGCRFDAAVTVVRAYLAERPADDAEPVTPEWLVEAAGFRPDDDPGLDCRTYSLECHSRGGGPVAYLVWSPWQGCDAWAVGSSPFAPDTLLPANFPTRGHVRRLLAALGVA